MPEYEMRISVWSSDVCSSDLTTVFGHGWPGTDGDCDSRFGDHHAGVINRHAYRFLGGVGPALRRLLPDGYCRGIWRCRPARCDVLVYQGWRSEERRDGKEGVGTGRSRWWAYY